MLILLLMYVGGWRQAAQTAPLRGFDLLRSTAGMTEEDIAIMRRQFHGGAEAEDRASPILL
jgi:hypothetical protein